eukprot:SAG31_NODE_548_length_14222_cov_10.926574_4_plen_87_part_00
MLMSSEDKGMAKTHALFSRLRDYASQHARRGFVLLNAHLYQDPFVHLGSTVRVVTFSFLCPLLEKYGTFIARCNALIEKVASFRTP